MQGHRPLIRRAGREDHDGIIALWNRAGLHHQPAGRDSRANLEREMEDPDVDFLVALVGGRIIGSVIGTNDGRKGWVNRLATDPDYRTEGVATALVKRVEVCFNDRSLKIFSCLINAENASSRSLFERYGYVPHPEVVYYSKKVDPDI